MPSRQPSLAIDLDAIDALPLQGSGNTKYLYDLPTLDDPTRANLNGIDDPSASGYDGIDPDDPFGGNDGLNQAKIVAGGPVQIHSPGYRNAYDLVIMSSPGYEGKLYAVDNGANGGWGGHPDGEADYDAETTVGQCTNNYLSGEPGSTGPGPGGDPKVNNKDNLHYVRELQPGDDNYVQPGEPYYAGHPTPVRGNPSGAGLYTKGEHTVNPNDGSDGYWRTQILDPSDPAFATQSLPVDWPAVPSGYAAECDFRNPGETDGALATFGSSTNGITEYTATTFGGSLEGSLMLASFDGSIYRVELSAEGDAVPNGVETFASGFGSIPLDVIAQGDADVFPGTVWAATYGSDAITVFEPDESLVCTGDYDNTIDEDADGYTNADEIDNGTDPCSASSAPKNHDVADEQEEIANGQRTFLLSDLNDPDDDNDSLPDTLDPFPLDAANGTTTSLPISYELLNGDPGFGFFGLGFTGLMTNGTSDYLDLFDETNLVAGGAVGLLTVEQVPPGDAFESFNDQANGFQFGVNVDAGMNPFTVHAQTLGPFFDNQPHQPEQSQGLFVGTGHQDDYVKVVLTDGLQVVHESGGAATITRLHHR